MEQELREKYVDRLRELETIVRNQGDELIIITTTTKTAQMKHAAAMPLEDIIKENIEKE